MKPLERAPPSKAAKQGSVLPVSMRGTRLPSNSCSNEAVSALCHLSVMVCALPSKAAEGHVWPVSKQTGKQTWPGEHVRHRMPRPLQSG